MKKRICILLSIMLIIAMIPSVASAKTTTYTAGYIAYKNIAPEGVNDGFFTSKTNREKVGSYYFYTEYSEDYSSSTLYCSKSETGKAVKIAKSTNNVNIGPNVIVGGGKVYFSMVNYDTYKTQIYRIGTDGKNKKLLKSFNDSGENDLIRIYNNCLYYLKDSGYNYNLCKLDLSTLKTTTVLKNVRYNYKFTSNLPGTSSSRYLYFTNGMQTEIYVFDCKTNKKINTVSVLLSESASINDYIVSGDSLYFAVEDYPDLGLYKASKTGKNVEAVNTFYGGSDMFGYRLVKDFLVYPAPVRDGEMPESAADTKYLKYNYETNQSENFPNWNLYIQLYG